MVSFRILKQEMVDLKYGLLDGIIGGERINSIIKNCCIGSNARNRLLLIGQFRLKIVGLNIWDVVGMTINKCSLNFDINISETRQSIYDLNTDC